MLVVCLIASGRGHRRLGDRCAHRCCPALHRCLRVLQETRYYQVGSASVADVPPTNVLMCFVLFQSRRKFYSGATEQLNKKPQ